jgi:Fe2+ transport system protein FeoA
MTTLHDLRPGDRAVVVGWPEGQAPPRLLEMGLIEGTEFEVLRLAPFGDPINIRIRGYQLSLRQAEAARIRVERR